MRHDPIVPQVGGLCLRAEVNLNSRSALRHAIIYWFVPARLDLDQYVIHRVAAQIVGDRNGCATDPIYDNDPLHRQIRGEVDTDGSVAHPQNLFSIGTGFPRSGTTNHTQDE